MNKLLPLLIFIFFSYDSDASKIAIPNSALFAPCFGAPAAPSNLKAITVSPSKIILNWTDNAVDEEGYLVERSSVSATAGFTQIASLGINVKTYTNAGLNTNKQYWYRVRAYCGAFFSTYTNIASSITLTFGIAHAIKPEIKSGIVNKCINAATGTYFYKQLDYNIPTVGRPLKFERYYNSGLNNYNRQMGFGWTHSYDYFITNIGDTIWNVHYGDGHESPFVKYSDGTATPIFGGIFETLFRNVNKTWSLTFKNQEVFLFDSTGVLMSITDRNGNQTILNYASGKLTTIVGPGGRKLTFTYNVNNRIQTITDTLTRTSVYSYNAAGNLITYTYPKAGTMRHTYDGSHKMIRMIDARNDTIVTNTYDGSNRILTQTDAANFVTTMIYDQLPADTVSAILTNGATPRYIHDSLYRLLIEYNENGDSLVYTYDQDFNCKSILDELNNLSSMMYDDRGNLTQITKSNLTSTQYFYNTQNDTTSIVDALNKTISMNYDANGNRISITDALNNMQTFNYNPAGQLTGAMDRLNHPVNYTYNSQGDMLTYSTTAGTTTYTYDAGGRVINISDANGHATNYTYDKANMITNIRDALSQNIICVYDNNNNLTEYKDKKGLSTFITYDKKNRPISIMDPLNAITQMTYDSKDNITLLTDPLSNVYVFSYDAKSRMNGSSNSIGIRQYAHDAVGNLTSETDETFHTTTYAYDALYRLTSITDALGNITKFTYDSLGQKLTMEDPRNLVTQYTYNANRQLVSIKDPLNNTSTFSYDANGNRTSETDPNGHTTIFGFNSNDRHTATIDAATNITTYSYDPKGNIISKTSPNGEISAYTYDVIDRLIKINYSTGDSSIFTYDPNGNLLSMTNLNGTTTLSYNKINNPVMVTDPFGNNISYAYNAAGLKTSITYPGDRVVSYAYNAVKNLTQVTDWMGHITTYLYNDAGRITRINYPNGTFNLNVFNNAGRLSETSNRFANNNIINRSIFTLDASGNEILEQRTEPLATLLLPQINNYIYLADNRLKTMDSVNYTNDGNGNRLSETGNYPITYTWTANNLLASLTQGTQRPVTYKYDPLGNRIQKKQGSEIRNYLLDLTQDPPQIMGETDSAGNIKGTNIFGIGLIARSDSANNVSYYHFDAHGNTLALSDSLAQITNTYAYEPFGELLKHVGNSTQPFLFGGRQSISHENYNIYYSHKRYYDANTGRYLSKDINMGNFENPQSLNRYPFGLNNPLKVLDKTLHFGQSDTGSFNPRFYKNENWLSKQINVTK